MAKIFNAIFDDMLPKEDLVELEGRERLPSPQELQGKIILKGSYKRDEVVFNMHLSAFFFKFNVHIRFIILLKIWHL